jgi:hypothetical protein
MLKNEASTTTDRLRLSLSVLDKHVDNAEQALYDKFKSLIYIEIA